MIGICKLCGNNMTSDRKPGSFLRATWSCDKCKQYSLICEGNGSIESETLQSGNFYLTFFPTYKTASIVSTSKVESSFHHDKKILKSFDMDEFTPEQAAHWNQKLKTYVLFQ